MDLEPDPENITTQLILIAVLIFLNAFFASAERVITSLNENKINLIVNEGNKKAKLLEKLARDPNKLFSTIQVGVTFAGYLSSALAAVGISSDLALFLDKLDIPYSSEISLIAITISLSYITLVLGELYPKKITLQNYEVIALFYVKPILFLSKLMLPFINLISSTTNLLVRITGIDKKNLEEKVSKKDIKSLVEVGQEHGIINEIENKMINSILEFNDKLADEVMTPRTEVYLIDIDRPLGEYLDELLEEKYSRIPVYKGDSDNIIGILYMKDLIIEARRHGFDNVEIKNILHTPYFVPERKNIDELFKELQSSQKHMAVLIDEYGGFSGIVTIEDLIEEIMGDIDDEFDDYEPDIRQIDNNTFMVNGLLPIEQLNYNLNLQLDFKSENYDTVGGFLIDIIGTIPKDGEKQVIEHDNILFKIEEIKEKRIEKVKIYIRREA